jgi:hypothetical protein
MMCCNRYLENMQLLCRILHATAWNLYSAFGLIVIINEPLEPRHLKFGVEIDHKHTYKFYVQYCLLVNNKYSSSVKLWVYVSQI